jgi:S-adenosylmethionine decarboxylase proenzyme
LTDIRAQHLLIEFTRCQRARLNDLPYIEQLMQQAATAAQTTVLASIFHPFQPQGVTGLLVIAQSHLSIHTWPQFAYASVDFYTCGTGLPEQAYAVLKRGLGAQTAECLLVDRGLSLKQTAMAVRYHHHR